MLRFQGGAVSGAPVCPSARCVLRALLRALLFFRPCSERGFTPGGLLLAGFAAAASSFIGICIATTAAAALSPAPASAPSEPVAMAVTAVNAIGACFADIVAVCGILGAPCIFALFGLAALDTPALLAMASSSMADRFSGEARSPSLGILAACTSSVICTTLGPSCTFLGALACLSWSC